MRSTARRGRRPGPAGRRARPGVGLALRAPASETTGPAKPRVPMPSLPSGTVTFLFTDIEGSTRLAESLGPGWPPLLEEHRAILRDAIAEGGGSEVGTEGDSFFVAFPTAAGALSAAVAAQRGLTA